MDEDSTNGKHGRNSIFVSVILILISSNQITTIKSSISSPILIEFKSIQLILWLVQIYYIWRHLQLAWDKINSTNQMSAFSFTRKHFFLKHLKDSILKQQEFFGKEHRLESIATSLTFKYALAIVADRSTNGDGLVHPLKMTFLPFHGNWWKIYYFRTKYFLEALLKSSSVSQAYLPPIFAFSAIAAAAVKHYLDYYQ